MSKLFVGLVALSLFTINAPSFANSRQGYPQTDRVDPVRRIPPTRHIAPTRRVGPTPPILKSSAPVCTETVSQVIDGPIVKTMSCIN
jgi:hypothetical protein